MSNAVRNQQKLMDVRHFGAVGDGVADDTAAINASAGRAVFFPAGDYLVNTGLTVGSGCRLHALH